MSLLKRTPKLYLTLFFSVFSLSAFTFGGGYVIVPLMKKKFVDRLRWLAEEEMLDLIAIAQSAPGPIAVNSAMLVGFRTGGWLGAALSLIGTVLPPLLILSVISGFYTAFGDNRIVAAVLTGMQAGVAAVIADVLTDMGFAVFKSKKLLSVLVMAGAFAAVYFFQINIALVLLICALIGAVPSICQKFRPAKHRDKPQKEEQS